MTDPSGPASSRARPPSLELAALFFLSGFSALVYQVLWLRLLSLIFGVTVHAASTVLAAFMAGLALGSVAAGVVADRVRRPLLWFAAAEALVGLTALGSPIALTSVEAGFVTLAGVLPDSGALLTVARFACAFLVLVGPTFLMGATLPLVIKSSLVRGSPLRRSAGLLYGANTAGAVAGTLAAAQLIGQSGIRASFLIAAAVNFLVAIGAVGLRARIRPDDRGSVAPAGTAVAPPPAAPRPIPITAARAVLIVSALSGFASLALEVIWFRILVVYLGGTVYAFVAMLSTVLGGIALGSWVVVPFMRRERPWLPVLAALGAGTGIAALLPFAVIAQVLDEPWIRTSHITTLVIAPATLLMGVAFPVGLRVWAEHDGRTLAERVGGYYALNVCGAVFGSIAAGFVLLPQIGARYSLIVSASLFVAGALILIAHVHGVSPVRRWSAAGLVVALFGWTAAALPDPFDAALSRHPGSVVWREEGIQATVSVHRRDDGSSVMYLDGLHQTNDSPEMVRVHRQIGALPLALHPNPTRLLVVGLGGGATAGAMSRHAGVSVDVIELSEAVAHAASWFRHVNYDVLAAPNVRLRVDDGRNFLLLNRRRYDVVTADIIQPIHAGANSLYSVEYYRLAGAALNDGGLMLQWIGRRETTPYKLIMRTFLSAFPQATLWADGSLMVGSRAPLRIDPAAFARKLEDPSTRALLASVGLGSVDELLRLYTAGPDEMRAFVGGGEVLTDDRPRVEYFKTLPAGEGEIDLTGLAGDVRRHLDTD